MLPMPDWRLHPAFIQMRKPASVIAAATDLKFLVISLFLRDDTCENEANRSLPQRTPRSG